MTEGLLALALALSAAAWHLAVTRLRARWMTAPEPERRPGLALALFPLGLLGPGLAVWGAAQVAPQLSWWVAGLLVVLHRLWVGALGRGEALRGGPPW